jgi:hypothetical protein
VNDDDAELAWTRFRCFDAETGTWISTDPLEISGGLNLYGFDGSPSAVVDPLGLSTKGGSCPSIVEQASAWQGPHNEDYPNKDTYEEVILKKGTVIWGGYPGVSEYYSTEGAVNAAGGSSKKFFESVQVRPSKERKYDHPLTGSYRPSARKYVVKEDTPAAYGIAKANTKWGSGGAPQYYIPNHADVLEPGEIVNFTEP